MLEQRHENMCQHFVRAIADKNLLGCHRVIFRNGGLLATSALGSG